MNTEKFCDLIDTDKPAEVKVVKDIECFNTFIDNFIIIHINVRIQKRIQRILDD